MKKKVAIIIPTLYSGGAEKQSVYLAKVLSEDFQVSLILLKGDRVEKKFLDSVETAGVKIVRLSGGLLKNMFDIFKFFRREKTAWVFSYLASSNLMNGVVGLLAGVPYRIGGIRNAELSAKKLPLERLFHNYFLTKTISNSHSAVNSLSKLGFKPEKFHVIHNAFSLNHQEIIRPVTNVVNIISVARFVPQKDYLTALQTIACLKDRLIHSQFDFKYFLIGYGGQEAQIREWVKDLGVEDKVEVVIKPDNLEEYFKKAAIFLTTSLFEGLSNSVMEALSFSLPVVATPAGDMEYLVKEGKNGFICEKKNAGQLADKLEILIRNAALREQMGHESYRLISENFTLEKFKNDYLSFIHEP